MRDKNKLHSLLSKQYENSLKRLKKAKSDAEFSRLLATRKMIKDEIIELENSLPIPT